MRSGLPDESETRRFDVHIVHTAADVNYARQLSRELASFGFESWMGMRDIRPGELITDAIDHALRSARIVITLVGADTGAWHKAELRAALELCRYKGIPLIPVLLPGVSEMPREQIIFIRELKYVRFVRNMKEPGALKALISAIREFERRLETKQAPQPPSSSIQQQ